MITSEIQQDDFLYHQRNQDAQVGTLDGEPIENGIASCDYDLEGRAGFSVRYQRGDKYFITFAVLRRPDGELVKSFSENFNNTLTYTAERPGKYPDDKETFQRFVNGKQTYTVKDSLQAFPKDIRDILKSADDTTWVHCYHPDLYLLEAPFDEPHLNRFICVDRNFSPEEDYATNLLEDAEEFLFDMFMLYGHTF